MNNIRKISFPNTIADYEQADYVVGNNCDEIKLIQKNGEMAGIGWFEIRKENEVIAEIKESVCNIYYK